MCAEGEPERPDLHLRIFTGEPAHVQESQFLSPLLGIPFFLPRRTSTGIIFVVDRSGRFYGAAAADLAAACIGTTATRAAASSRPAIGSAIYFSRSELRRPWPICFQEAGAGSCAARDGGR